MASQPWEDRRGIFQRGKEVHEPGRRLSQNSGVLDAVRRSSSGSMGDAASGLSKTTSNASISTSSQRRRSSAASGLFSNLQQHKRGSEDYAERRASYSDQLAGGMMSGWFNSTFRGIKPSKVNNAETQKKGVME